MDILKAATDWAKAELVSTPYFILFGLLFLAACIGFWQFGKTDFAKAYVIPLAVAGVFLLITGLGLYFTNKSRITQFQTAYHEDPAAFVDAEIARTERTLNEYQTIVFTAIPLIIAACALALLFLHGPMWRASLVSFMAMLVVISLIDGLAHARIQEYSEQLTQAKTERIP